MWASLHEDRNKTAVHDEIYAVCFAVRSVYHVVDDGVSTEGLSGPLSARTADRLHFHRDMRCRNRSCTFAEKMLHVVRHSRTQSNVCTGIENRVLSGLQSTSPELWKVLSPYNSVQTHLVLRRVLRLSRRSFSCCGDECCLLFLGTFHRRVQPSILGDRTARTSSRFHPVHVQGMDARCRECLFRVRKLSDCDWNGSTHRQLFR